MDREEQEKIYRSPILHPMSLLGIWVGVGCLFALQEYAQFRSTPSHMTLRVVMTLWALYTLTCGGMFVVVWLLLRRPILTAGWRYLMTHILPLSIVVSVLEEMLYVAAVPILMHPWTHRTYWARLQGVIGGDLVTNIAFFWIAILIARGVGYYESYRRKEISASRLEKELVSAQLRALRMQLNPHFLFNTMNGISSLMRGDPDSADRMLEQLSRLLRMTLDRGDVQQVTLRDEVDFVRLYLEIQQARFGERVRYEIDLSPDTLDALIPTMILQPLVENAYQHGISRTASHGRILIRAAAKNGELVLSVMNTREGLPQSHDVSSEGGGVGLANLKSRLMLHYLDRQSFTLRDIEPAMTEARLTLPLTHDLSLDELQMVGLQS